MSFNEYPYADLLHKGSFDELPILSLSIKVRKLLNFACNLIHRYSTINSTSAYIVNRLDLLKLLKIIYRDIKN